MGFKSAFKGLTHLQRWLSVPHVNRHHTSKGCRQERNKNNTHPT